MAERREVLRGAALAAAAMLAGGCAREAGGRRWRMVTSWPAGFPGLAEAAETFAARLAALTEGRWQVEVLPAGARVAAFEVFDAVSRGEVELGHSAAYYWQQKMLAAPFFCAVPFGLTALEMRAWLAHGGGLALWRELYAPHGVVPYACGNTGMQLAGWFNREINSLADLKGLRVRMPGLGGEVVRRLGAVPVNVAGADIVAAFERNALDGCEWLGPFNDHALGLHRVAKYCYYPGWQEPGSVLELLVHAPAHATLREPEQQLLATLCAALDDEVLARSTARNAEALATLSRDHGLVARPLPAQVLDGLRRESAALIDQLAAADPFAKRAADSMRAFRTGAAAWSAQGDLAYAAAR